MIIVHHLNNSRSQRVLWLLEELGLPYEIKKYERDATTNLAPAELKRVHPLGKSPVVEDGGEILAETGAIIQAILDRHGKGRLTPPKGTPEYARYRYWMHAAEGSYMPPLLMTLLLTRMETAPMPFFARPIAKRLVKGVGDGYVNPTRAALLNYLEAELSRSPWLAGADLTAADIIMSFPAEAASQRAPEAKGMKNLKRFVDACHARPAFKRALERGGPYAFA